MYKILSFTSIADNRGALIPIEQLKDVPFDIKRIYYMFDTKLDVVRGKHSHKYLEQVLICVNGSCKIMLDDGYKKEIIKLYDKNIGLYIGPNVWHEMFEFTKDTVLLVLASDYYNEAEYIRNYEKFLKYVKNNKTVF